jgi:hypothetical protein
MFLSKYVMALKLTKGGGELILMCGRVQAFEIEWLLQNLMNGTQRGHQWAPFGRCKFCIMWYVKFICIVNY